MEPGESKRVSLIVADTDVELLARFLKLSRELPVRLRFAVDLEQLADLIATEPPDALVVSGELRGPGENLYRMLHQQGARLRCFKTAGPAVCEILGDDPDVVTPPQRVEQMLAVLLSS